MSQLTLEQAAKKPERLARIRRRTQNKPLSIEASFKAFHEANPHVYEKLREFALQMKRASNGREKYGAKALFERLRWHYRFEVQRTEGAGEWKINNNYTALYARLLMQQEEELAGFFETRERRSELTGE